MTDPRMLPPDWRESTTIINGVSLHIAEAGLALCDDGRLEIIEGASHWLPIEEPDRINRRIVAFLRSGR